MLVAAAATADPMRVATWHGDLSYKGPGLLLRALMRDEVDLSTVRDVAPDVLLLTDIDYDAGHVALGAIQASLLETGHDLPYRFALRPNSGTGTGLDLDGDGRLGGPRDAQGFGWFSGQGGMALLSRYPMHLHTDLSPLLWVNAPETRMTADDPGPDTQRLSSKAHWAVTLDTPIGPVTLLTLSTTPPVFDGPEDRNGRRNHDEVMLWLHVLDGKLATLPEAPVILFGHFNLDPRRGQGLHAAAQQALSHARLQDPTPGVDTVTWESTGPMRVSYVLPDTRFSVTASDITAPVPEMGPHRLVWVDLLWP